ncbi:MAG: UDP-N-acetylmuramoylalanine-D-glutamate ligase [Candidatus Levybacteria bacterium GW2011_GWA2_40_8]|nr:MAG: UDP-N-acetylmuramoylalanine-D-glutamate ligase [Candidatus Levybacteria bacterium GW2011_GWA2_40_8]
MMNFKGKKIAVIGEGLEGKSSADFLKKHGAEVTVLDVKQGGKYLDGLEKYDLIVRSPGVRLPELERKVSKDKITSQTKLFFEECPCPIIGVTGTKGKGTTASLIYEMLKAEGKDAYLGGNIGVPPFEFLDKLKPSSIVVLELSSFQLIDLHKSPHIAVVLMITSEHLDYHKDVLDYVSAKRNILRFQKSDDFAIINREYPASNESDVETNAKVYFVSREREIDEGCFARDGKIVIRTKEKEIPVFETKDLMLRGEHNFENVCAAVMAAYLAGVSLKSIQNVLADFKGLEHRLEFIGQVNGAEYYNDSFSTTPETAIAAIEAFEEPEILILGGSSKKSNFEELGQLISGKGNIKAIIGIGKEWPRIKEHIKSSSILMIEEAKDMHTVVQVAAKIALPGDVVLLSPACASFDMFKNYKDRGEQFKKEVKSLQRETIL